MTPHKPSGSLREGSSFPFLAINSAHLWGAQLLCCLLPGWERSAFIIPLPIRAAGLVLQSGRWQKGSGCLTGRWEGQNGPKRGLAGKTRAVWFLRCWRALAQERKQHCCFQLPSFPVRWSVGATGSQRSTTLGNQTTDTARSALCTLSPSRPVLTARMILSSLKWLVLTHSTTPGTLGQMHYDHLLSVQRIHNHVVQLLKLLSIYSSKIFKIPCSTRGSSGRTEPFYILVLHFSGRKGETWDLRNWHQTMIPWLLIWSLQTFSGGWGTGNWLEFYHIWVISADESHLWPCHSLSWTLDPPKKLSIKPPPGSLQLQLNRFKRATSPALVTGLTVQLVPEASNVGVTLGNPFSSPYIHSILSVLAWTSLSLLDCYNSLATPLPVCIKWWTLPSKNTQR